MTTTDAKVVTYQLGPTKTFTRRRLTWVPGDTGDGRIGTARVTCQRANHNRDSDEFDSYGVLEDVPEHPRPIRTFLFKNDTSPEEEGEERDEVYQVVVGAKEGVCSCKAGKCKLPCKHLSALTKLIQEQQL